MIKRPANASFSCLFCRGGWKKGGGHKSSVKRDGVCGNGGAKRQEKSGGEKRGKDYLTLPPLLFRILPCQNDEATA
jgi:hypothetical protein